MRVLDRVDRLHCTIAIQLSCTLWHAFLRWYSLLTFETLRLLKYARFSWRRETRPTSLRVNLCMGRHVASNAKFYQVFLNSCLTWWVKLTVVLLNVFEKKWTQQHMQIIHISDNNNKYTFYALFFSFRYSGWNPVSHPQVNGSSRAHQPTSSKVLVAISTH